MDLEIELLIKSFHTSMHYAMPNKKIHIFPIQKSNTNIKDFWHLLTLCQATSLRATVAT